MDLITKGIVLKSNDYREADKLLTLLTFDKGKITVKARGAKKQSSKLKAFCQPFCFADFELVNGKAGFILSGGKSFDNFFNLIVDIDKYPYAFSIIEILDKICVENQDYSSLLLEALKALKEMNYGQISPSLLLAKFMLSTLFYEGFSFNLERCASCGEKLDKNVFIDFQSGELFCGHCAEGIEELDRAVFSTLRILSQNDYSKLSTIKLQKNILDRTLHVLMKDFSFRYEIIINSFKLL